jgi:acyl dehydratase
MTPCPLSEGFSSQKKGLHRLKFRSIAATCRDPNPDRITERIASAKVKAMSPDAAAIEAKLIPLEDYRKLLNGDVLTSDWLAVDQSMIDTFANATHDHQFIHVDPVRAKETPFGGTIAHGFLTLSLLSPLAFDAMPGVKGTRMGVNFGFEKVRFMSPVKSGARVRGKFRLIGLTERAVTVQSTWQSTIEVEGTIKPALEAHWITVAMVEPQG